MAAAACVALLAMLTGVALAQGAVSEKLRSGGRVTIAAGETVSNDLYAFAGTVQIDGTVDGDLVASGGRVDITGTVTGDVLAAGGSVNITGTVGGDTRIAGGTLSVGGAIKEDLARGRRAAHGHAIGDGRRRRHRRYRPADHRRRGDGQCPGADRDVHKGRHDRRDGGRHDHYPGTSFPAGPTGAAPTPTQQVMDAVRHFLVVVLTGALLIWFAPRAYAAMKSALRERPLPAAGWGIVAILGFVVLLIVVLIAMILLAIVFGLLGFSDLVGIDILGGIVVILGASLAFAVVAGYVADALVGVVQPRMPAAAREALARADAAGATVSANGTPAVECRDIVFGYGARATVLHGVDFVVKKGTIHGLIGPNGSGKSTLVDLIAGRLRPLSGTIKLDGESFERLGPAARAKHRYMRTFQGLGAGPGSSGARQRDDRP